jgi:hypothetical protein
MENIMTTAKTVTLELTVEELNTILAALGELPAKISIGLIDKIRKTATEQLQVEPTEVPVQ